MFQGGAGSATIQDALTSINANFYYGEPTIPYQANIKGTANMWGAISIPPTNFNNQPVFFNSNLLKPHIAFHGKLDDVFPYDNSLGKQYVDFSIPPDIGETDYNLEDFCIRTNNGSYFLDVDPLTRDLINGSSLNMRNILNFYGIANELYVDCDMKHGLSSNGQFLGDFGTTATTQNQASVYIAQRMATFFQAVLSGNAGNIGTNYFPNCPNTRSGCPAKTTTCTDCN